MSAAAKYDAHRKRTGEPPPMTVAQLRAALVGFADDAQVYGYWDTIAFELRAVLAYEDVAILDVSGALEPVEIDELRETLG